MKPIVLGRYQHYKGKHYLVLGVGRHTESMEELVVYKALYDDPEFGSEAIWIRPRAMFEETVVHEGEHMPRFTLISDL